MNELLVIEKIWRNKRVIRQNNGQKKKYNQRSIKHYTENLRSSNTGSTKNRAWTQVHRKGKRFLFHMWHPSCCSCYNPVISHEYGKDRIVITTNGTYHVVMCDTDSVRRSGLSPQVYLSNETKSGERLKFDHCIVHVVRLHHERNPLPPFIDAYQIWTLENHLLVFSFPSPS
jgi:hypothetical protein